MLHNTVGCQLNLRKIKLLCILARSDIEIIIHNKEICLTITPNHGNLAVLLCFILASDSNIVFRI